MTQLSADGQEGAQEKPLHAKVGEALGWTDIHYGARFGDILIADMERMRWFGRAPGEMMIGEAFNDRLIPRYDTDWSATGPLIEQFLDGRRGGFHLWIGNGEWNAGRGDDRNEWNATGPTPLIAVCELLLKLGEAGKL